MLYNFNSISSHPILKNSKGVYCIESEKGVQYIGSTCVSFKDRWRSHLSALKLNKHHSKHMQNCYNKYGAEYFSLSILYYGDEKEDILKCEQHYIDTLKPKFNTCLTVAYSVAGFKHSEKSVEQNRAIGREKAIADAKGVRLGRDNTYTVYTRLKNHILQLGGFSSEEEAKVKQKEIRDYFWSDEFESKNLVDQDEEVALYRLQHRVKIKTNRETSGAVFDLRLNKYRARLYVEGKVVNFGSFEFKKEAEEAYKQGRSIFVSEEFLLLPPEDKELFIKNFRASYKDSRNSNGYRYIRYSRNRYIFKYSNSYQKSFKTLEEAVQHRDEFIASGCSFPSPKLKAKSGHEYIHLYKNNRARFQHIPTKHCKTFLTLEEAVAYKEQYLVNLEADAQY